MRYELPAAGSIVTQLQRAARPRRRARRPRGARAPPPGRGDRRRRPVRQGPGGARATPTSAVVGCVGAIDVRSIAWWEGSVTLASFINRYEEHGGGDLHSFSWTWEDAPPYAQTGEVETLDGFVLALSPVGRAQHPLRRVAQPLPRLRPRLLPPGPRGRPQGGDGGLPRDPPPRDRDAPGPGGVDRGPHQRRREVGRPDAGHRHRRRAAGASGRCAPRPSATPPRRWRTRRCSSSRRAPASSSAALAETRESLSWRLSAPLRWVGRSRRRRAGGRARRASPDDRVRLGDRRPRGLPALRRSRASGAPPSRTPWCTRSRPSATSCRGYNLLLDTAAAP